MLNHDEVITNRDAAGNTTGEWLRAMADIEGEGKIVAPQPALVHLALAPHVLQHLHWLATQHGLTLARLQNDAHGEQFQRVLDESRINGVALAILTDKVRRL